MNTRQASLAAIAAALIIDQSVKALMLYGFGFAGMGIDARITVLPFLDLVMRWNCGISFSLLCVNSPTGIAALITFVAAVIAVLFWWMWHVTRKPLAIGLGLVIGGALGNLIDRLVHGWVADFFDLHAFGRDFFACNPADVMISLGVLLLIYDSVIDSSGARVAAK
ncbi:MAG TPA: signal peptidase II [Rhizomicrobium sp.]|jgi:signal peptidase II